MIINSSLSAASTPPPAVSLARPTAPTDAAASAAANAAVDFSSTLDPQSDGIFDAQTSVANAISFTQTQDGLLQSVGTALDRMSQLATSAQAPTATDGDRAGLNQLFQALSAYVNKAAGQDFNGVSLFDASGFSVNTDGSGGDATLTGVDLSGSVYAAAMTADISTLQGPPAGGTTDALGSVQAALKQLSTDRATVGANQDQLETISTSLDISAENLNAATSNITSLAGAQQSVAAAGNSILNQSSIALLAQGHAASQSVLNLLPQ